MTATQTQDSSTVLLPTETLDRHICQNGVKPGPVKLAQFQYALALRGTPALYAQDGKGREAIAYVKLFDPCGSWTWYVTEWDGAMQAFGLCCGFEAEFGYIDLQELSEVAGQFGIGMEIDVWFKPQPIRNVWKD